MKDGYESDWHILCCKNDSGACGSCSRGTLAYVSGYTKSGGWSPPTKHKSIYMRFCPDGMNSNYGDEITGLTIFHELMHMTSIVGDSEYTKRGMVALARNDPYKARMNSDSYTMYIAQSSLNRRDYDKFTRTSSNSEGSGQYHHGDYSDTGNDDEPSSSTADSPVHGHDNGDKYGNCASRITDCCFDRMFTNGELKRDGCSKTCAAKDNTSACRQESSCFNTYDNCDSFINGSNYKMFCEIDDLAKGCC